MMHRILIYIPVLFFFSVVSCSEQKTVEQTEAFDYWVFGDTIPNKPAVKAAELVYLMEGKGHYETSLEGVVVRVCQTKGCWMTIDLENGDVMRVTFKDYGFFVPKDIDGKSVIIEGFAFNDTTGVDALRHYALDAGKTQEEIDAITDPQIELRFEAHGVLLAKEQFEN